jgi:hypothetical protein
VNRTFTILAGAFLLGWQSLFAQGNFVISGSSLQSYFTANPDAAFVLFALNSTNLTDENDSGPFVEINPHKHQYLVFDGSVMNTSYSLGNDISLPQGNYNLQDFNLWNQPQPTANVLVPVVATQVSITSAGLPTGLPAVPEPSTNAFFFPVQPNFLYSIVAQVATQPIVVVMEFAGLFLVIRFIYRVHKSGGVFNYIRDNERQKQFEKFQRYQQRRQQRAEFRSMMRKSTWGQRGFRRR